ncbi:alpha/beta-hydrolase [Abortiporus biennis]|nr:alpha/beta-hydrolase [Abortiporus biennis]
MIPAKYTGFLWALVPSLFFLSGSSAQSSQGLPSAASLYVSHLPDLHQNESRPLHMYAGHIPSDPAEVSVAPTDVTAHLYFFMVKARRTADKERIMFWLNGGPGCSSFDGLMMEVGPWRVDGKGGLKTKEGGWEEYTTMVYLDQPAGTGFSYTSSNKYLHELPEASNHFVQFLRNFYTVFPEYKNMDMYIGGESYAGQYIPYFADAVLQSNLNIPIRGAAIGNGWTDAKTQYPSFLDYAVKHGLVEENSEDYKRGKEYTDKCIADLAKVTDHVPVHSEFCERTMGVVVEHKMNHMVKGTKKCLNIYDIRLEDTSPACGMNWPEDLTDIGHYLQRPDVVNAIHATAAPLPWKECRGNIHREFTTKTSNSSITVLPRVLENIPVLLFAGDQDLICNYMGIESMVQSMTWNGATGLGTVQTQSWAVNATPAGTWVTSRNLTYVKIFNASHMAGYDVPHVTHDMILRFMGVDFGAITDGSAKIPSAVGNDHKPIAVLVDQKPTATPAPVNSPEQDKAMWEAYYNAGSAALVLVVIAVIIGGFLWWRSRRGNGLLGRGGGVGLPLHSRDLPEESIPLTTNGEPSDDDFTRQQRARKGKERARDVTPKDDELFEIGDDAEGDELSADIRGKSH